MDDSFLPDTQTQRPNYYLSQSEFLHPWIRNCSRGQKRKNCIMEEEVDDELPQTLTLTPHSDILKLSQEAQQISPPWGRLYPWLKRLEAFDLYESTICLGRSLSCDLTINQQNFPPNQWNNLSKKHFTITKDGDLVYIQDHSKNGTYINGKPIGRGKRVILRNDDVISIGHVDLKAFVYKPMNPDDPYLPEKLKEKYVLSKPLGKGACGEVHLLFNKLTTKRYAVKRIIKGNTSNINRLNHPLKIQREIDILKSLKHHFIISMEEIIDTGDEIYIVLEFMAGGELNNLIDKHLNEAQCKFIFYQILQGVYYLHLNGIAHRDLKSENVLLTNKSPDALIKITDFGLSKIIGENDLLKTTCGTPQYVAPEVIDERYDNYTPQVDVWSLGVILYQLLSGHLPFQSSNRSELYGLIQTGNYEFDNESWMGVSECAKDLVRKMLTVNPYNRIKIKDIFNHSWIDKDIAMQYKVKQCIRQTYNTDNDDSDMTGGSSCSGIDSDIVMPPLAKYPRLEGVNSSIN